MLVAYRIYNIIRSYTSKEVIGVRLTEPLIDHIAVRLPNADATAAATRTKVAGDCFTVLHTLKPKRGTSGQTVKTIRIIYNNS